MAAFFFSQTVERLAGCGNPSQGKRNRFIPNRHARTLGARLDSEVGFRAQHHLRKAGIERIAYRQHFHCQQR